MFAVGANRAFYQKTLFLVKSPNNTIQKRAYKKTKDKNKDEKKNKHLFGLLFPIEK